MRASRTFDAVDSHTEGMPTRVVTGGVGVLPGATMAERRLWFMENSDELRTLFLFESLTDEQLVVAQGQENSARTDLSFIEKALFAARLEEYGYDPIYFEDTAGGHSYDADPAANARRWARHYVYFAQQLMDD